VKRFEKRQGRAEVDLGAAAMEGRIHEGQVEAGTRCWFSRVPPDDLTAITQVEPVDVHSSAFDRAGVRVRQQDLRFRPQRCGCDSEYACATTEVDHSFGWLVSHISREGFEQELTPGIELFCAEHARQGFEQKLEAFSVNGFDRGQESRRVFRLRSRAGILLETNDARPRSVGDDDRCLAELRREPFDRGNDAERIRPGKE
jgi:hypothetical protein